MVDARAAAAHAARSGRPRHADHRHAAVSRRTRTDSISSNRSRSKRPCAGPSSAWNTASCKCRIRAISGCSIRAPIFRRNARTASPASFNPQLASSASSPVPVALESHVIRAVARRAGMRRGCDRTFCHRRIRSELHGTDLRPDRRPSRYSADGVRAFAGPVRFYTSRDCHIAWLKIAHQAGVGRNALRLVATRRPRPNGPAGAAQGHCRGPRRAGRCRS